MDIETEVKDICKRLGLTYHRHVLREDTVVEIHVTLEKDGAWGILQYSTKELEYNEAERKLRNG